MKTPQTMMFTTQLWVFIQLRTLGMTRSARLRKSRWSGD
jgi:hypothetical protein